MGGPTHNVKFILTYLWYIFNALLHGSLHFFHSNFINFSFQRFWLAADRFWPIGKCLNRLHHGEQNQCYSVKDHNMLYQKCVSQVPIRFVWSHTSKKQTGIVKCVNSIDCTNLKRQGYSTSYACFACHLILWLISQEFWSLYRKIYAEPYRRGSHMRTALFLVFTFIKEGLKTTKV